MTNKEWEEIDRSSRTIVSCLLSCLGATEIGETHGNCCVDLSCTINSKSICIEVKDRSFESTRYNDILVEDIKQDCTSRRLANGQFDAALAVNVFTDNIIAIANLYDKRGRRFQRYAPTTTLVKDGDHTYVKKTFVSLPQVKRYRYNMIDNKYTFTKEQSK